MKHARAESGRDKQEHIMYVGPIFEQRKTLNMHFYYRVNG